MRVETKDTRLLRAFPDLLHRSSSSATNRIQPIPLLKALKPDPPHSLPEGYFPSPPLVSLKTSSLNLNLTLNPRNSSLGFLLHTNYCTGIYCREVWRKCLCCAEMLCVATVQAYS